MILNTTRAGKALAPVVDIFPQIAVGAHDDDRIAEEMRLLKDFGFDRVYFVLCNPGYPMFSNPMLCLQPPNVPGLENYSFQSISMIGDPNFAYLHHCRRLGMEAYAIIKPYEGGGGATVPHGAKMSCEVARVKTIGGDRFGFDALLGKHPELRVKRRPIPDYERLVAQAVEEISIVFCVEAVEDLVAFDGMTLLSSKGGEAERWAVKPSLYVSEDNGSYSRFDGDLGVSDIIESRVLYDSNGKPLFSGIRQRCRVITLSNLESVAHSDYFAVALESEGRMFTVPYSMMALHGLEGEIPSTVPPYLRQMGNPIEAKKEPHERLWGMENQPEILSSLDAAVERLCEWGVEFEWYGSGFWGPGWSDAPVFGIARGKLKWMKGTPCEAYPEVRADWLDWVNKCIEMGFDGVDLRLQNHSGMVSNYMDFGYNEPIVDAYHRKHGVDLLKEPDAVDPLKLMGVRGDFFMDFAKDAAEALHRAGRKLQVHLRNCHECPKLSPDFNELGFWAMPKVYFEDWRKLVDLADEITLKDYHFNDYKPSLASEIKRYAKLHGKRLWVHCYISQTQELNLDFFRDIDADPDVGGVLLYEVAHSLKNEVNHGLIEQYGPVGLHEPIAKKLREIMADRQYE